MGGSCEGGMSVQVMQYRVGVAIWVQLGVKEGEGSLGEGPAFWGLCQPLSALTWSGWLEEGETKV